METVILTKPPWEGIEKQWQKRVTGDLTAAHIFQFEAWSESSCEALQEAKEKIREFERSKKWELLKKMVNPYEMVFTHEDPHYHPSLSLKRPLSRSYFKMIEMLDVLDFFPRLSKTNPNLRTAHIAEGPGGFIQATIDIAERHSKCVKRATAMTLRPTTSHIPGWRRALTFLHNHKEVKIHYGYDNTGDIYVKENQDSFIECVSPGVHLFTADGGFDFSSDYSQQEKSIFRLLACSAYTGLRCLMADGAMVIKFFDSFSESTAILLSCMSRCFREWMIYKPALSRPCNSERYFLGRGFIGLSPVIRALLEEICSKSGVDLYPNQLGFASSFTEEKGYIEHQQSISVESQLSSLSKSMWFADHLEEWYTTQLPLDFQKSLQWCNRFKIPTSLKGALKIQPPLIWNQRDECTSSQDADQQSQLPDVGSGCPGPYDQAC